MVAAADLLCPWLDPRSGRTRWFDLPPADGGGYPGRSLEAGPSLEDRVRNCVESDALRVLAHDRRADRLVILIEARIAELELFLSSPVSAMGRGFTLCFQAADMEAGGEVARPLLLDLRSLGWQVRLEGCSVATFVAAAARAAAVDQIVIHDVPQCSDRIVTRRLKMAVELAHRSGIMLLAANLPDDIALKPFAALGFDCVQRASSCPSRLSV